ncbi:MAG: hypothetical protein QN140_11305 [Armatimonadota bacterium]|nr:hypothetical protein [Armatimonadota bacterium]
MARYLIETRHTPEQCLADLDTVLEQSPGLLQKLEWGCRAGVHVGWITLEAPSAQDVVRQIPATMRDRTRVVEIQPFTPDEIRALHVK